MRAASSATSFTAVGWAAFLLLTIAAVLIASDVPTSPAIIFGGIVSLLFAYRYPYASFALVIALTPLLGLTVHLPTGTEGIGQRAFGGAIDIQLVDAVSLALLAAWALKVILLWFKRGDVNWKPWLPVVIPMAAVVIAHALSALSPFHPDPILVIKNSLRPVFWCYLVFVALTANLLRSQRRLAMALEAVCFMGMLGAIMGFISLGMPGEGILPRAHPFQLFGVYPFGDNHNLLSEWLVVSIPATIALALMAKHPNTKRLYVMAAAFQTLITLLTFGRTAWIVLAAQAFAMAMFVWREQAQRWFRPVLITGVLLLPLFALMVSFSSSDVVQSSTTTRLMLTEISLNLWKASPLVGMGAGTFTDHVTNTWIFAVEFGGALDAHGFIQKLLAETGILGVLAVAWFFFAAFRLAWTASLRLSHESQEGKISLLLMIMAGGAVLFQLFNTSYWNGKLWLAIGLMLAATRVFGTAKTSQAEPFEG